MVPGWFSVTVWLLWLQELLYCGCGTHLLWLLVGGGQRWHSGHGHRSGGHRQSVASVAAGSIWQWGNE